MLRRELQVFFAGLGFVTKLYDGLPSPSRMHEFLDDGLGSPSHELVKQFGPFSSNGLRRGWSVGCGSSTIEGSHLACSRQRTSSVSP